MPEMSIYLGSPEPKRAEKIWQRILERPASIVIVRNRTRALAVQTVRVEYMTASRDHESKDMSISASRDVIIYGVRNHPDETVRDTDIQRGDRFTYNGQTWVVDNVVFVLGGIQAKGLVNE